MTGENGEKGEESRVEEKLIDVLGRREVVCQDAM